MESDEAAEEPVDAKALTVGEWSRKSAAAAEFLKTNFNRNPTVYHTPGSSQCGLRFCHRVKNFYNIKPFYSNLHVVWKVNPRTRFHHLFYKDRVQTQIFNILNYRLEPQDRISFFPFSHHILLIVSGKIECDLEHNWSSLLDDNFPWPCGCPCGTVENALWEEDDEYKFPLSNTSGWVSEPNYPRPFEVKPLAWILTAASPAPRIYKRRKARFSDRKGNR